MAGFRNGLKKAGKVWHYKFKARGIVHHGSTGCASHDAAKEWLRAYRDATAKREVGIKAGPAPTLKEVYEGWVKAHAPTLSEKHMDRMELAWTHMQALAKLPIDRVTSGQVEKMRSAYLETHKPAGANLLMRYLRLLFGWAIKQEWIQAVPYHVSPIRLQRQPRPWIPREKAGQFFEAIDAAKDWQLSVLTRSMFWVGLRIEEAYGLRWEWFTPDCRTYTPGHTKGKEAQPLPIPDDLRALLLQKKQASGWVLPRPKDGGPYNGKFGREEIRAAGVACGVPGITPHRLRASCATNLARSGASAFTIQRQLRHKAIATTLIYTEIGLDDLRAAQEKMVEWHDGGTKPEEPKPKAAKAGVAKKTPRT